MSEKEFNEDEKVVNPHDKFYKTVFSDIGVAKDFLKNYLPMSVLKLVELNDLELQNGSYVDKSLAKFFQICCLGQQLTIGMDMCIFCSNIKVTQTVW
jgi:hypothetical protein